MDQGPGETPSPGVGDLYALHEKLAGWGPKSRYYNPPVVLVLALPDGHSVFVCQTYGDQEFAGPDDVCLGGKLAGFAQPWNGYTLMREDLGLHLGTVAPQVVERVRQRLEKKIFAPQPGSLLWFFRQMEVETGFFFSHRAVTRLLEQHESALVPVEADNNAILRDLRKLPVRFTTTDLSTAPLSDVLCWAEADPTHLPLAAADTETTPHALLFTLNNGAITNSEVVPLSLSFHEYAAGLLTVNGSVGSLPSGFHTWIVRWQSGKQLIEPLPDHCGHEDAFFWAVFSLTQEQIMPPSCLVVRIVCESRP